MYLKILLIIGIQYNWSEIRFNACFECSDDLLCDNFVDICVLSLQLSLSLSLSPALSSSLSSSLTPYM